MPLGKKRTFEIFRKLRVNRPKVDASILDSALSHTRRSNASEKREENSVSTFGRFRLWTSFENDFFLCQGIFYKSDSINDFTKE